MHYLVLGCDVAGNEPLRSQFDNAPPMPDLPAELCAGLLSWNKRMGNAVHAAAVASNSIAHLNIEGEKLASRIALIVPGGAKVRYLKE